LALSHTVPNAFSCPGLPRSNSSSRAPTGPGRVVHAHAQRTGDREQENPGGAGERFHAFTRVENQPAAREQLLSDTHIDESVVAQPAPRQPAQQQDDGGQDQYGEPRHAADTLDASPRNT